MCWHFSRRSAAAFLTAVTDAGVLDKSLTLKHFCLSSEVAAPLLQAQAQHVAVAARPTEQALLDLIAVD